MTKTTKTILIVLIVLLIPAAAGLGYWYFTRKKANDDAVQPEDGNNNNAANNAANNTTNTTQNAEKFPLTYNEKVKSELVKEVQGLLNEKIDGLLPPAGPKVGDQYIKQLVTDGYYGKKTAAVIAYVFPASGDGKKFTKQMYDELLHPTKNYVLF